MGKPYRIAIGSIIIECNHLGGTPADIDHFRCTELRLGEEILRQESGVVGGMLGVLRERGVDVAPLVVASACPSGPLTSACYRQLKSEMIDRLSRAMPVEGVLLALHGAAAAEDAGDLEGDLLTAVRGLIGPNVPVVVTLDLHADVTEPMVRCADAILAWETYPHRDTFETGVRGAKMLLDILDGKCRPAMAMAKVPLLAGAIHGNTEGEGPFADVMRFAKSHEGKSGVLSTSVFLVHPYLDLPGMGGGGLVVVDADVAMARSLAREIAMRYWERRLDLEPPLFSPAEAIARGLQIDGGPVLLVETADCCGGGAAGDSVASLRALLDGAADQPSLVPVVDPAAAALCHRLGPGRDVAVELGHKVDPQWGKPVAIRAAILTLGDGRFVYSGGVWAGQEGNMGPSAVLKVGAIQILVMSRPTYDWNDEQFRSAGLDVRRAKFIVVKNPMNYQMAYAGITRAAFILDTPGPTPPTMRHHRYRNLERPYYPADEEIPGLVPTVFS
jgi:microcystin degradation protein MlrC